MSNSLVTLWTVAQQAPLSMGFPREEYWCGLPFPSPGDLLDPGIKPRYPELQADYSLSEPRGGGAQKTTNEQKHPTGMFPFCVFKVFSTVYKSTYRGKKWLCGILKELLPFLSLFKYK